MTYEEEAEWHKRMTRPFVGVAAGAVRLEPTA